MLHMSFIKLKLCIIYKQTDNVHNITVFNSFIRTDSEPRQSNKWLEEHPRTHVSIDSNQLKREVVRRHYESRARGQKDAPGYYQRQNRCILY